jgi:hypothetical protein
MATLDFTSLVRSSIGFAQLPGILAHALERPETTYPPYNVPHRHGGGWLRQHGTRAGAESADDPRQAQGF